MLSSPAVAALTPTAFWQLRQMCSPSPNGCRLGCNVPKVLQPQTRVVLSKAAVLQVWLFVRLFQSASSGRQQRRVEKLFKMNDLFHYAAVAFRFWGECSVSSHTPPPLSPLAVRLVATLTQLDLCFLPVLQSLHHLHYSCPFADPIRWPLARMRFYFYFSSDPRSFLGLGLTFLHWTPY